MLKKRFILQAFGVSFRPEWREVTCLLFYATRTDVYYCWRKPLQLEQEILQLLDEVLGLQGRALHFRPDTPLLGAVPELDSMAVVGVIAALEERYGLFIADDEIDGTTFATVGNLVETVRQLLRNKSE